MNNDEIQVSQKWKGQLICFKCGKLHENVHQHENIVYTGRHRIK